MKRRDHLGDKAVNVGIILKWLIGFIWLTVEPIDKLLTHGPAGEISGCQGNKHEDERVL
jgi:hypothetical protein